MIRSVDRGWRPFRPSDAHPDRISLQAYREQMLREADLRAASAADPARWAQLLVTTFGSPDRAATNPAGLFDRLIAELTIDPAFAAAVATGRLDVAARAAVGSACARLIGAARPIPAQFADPLARHLVARASPPRPQSPR